MSEFQKWEIESESASRFWAAVLSFEGIVRGWRFRRIQKKHLAQFTELPPIVHAGVVTGECEVITKEMAVRL
jgi:hypothetical protein